ncbi:DUF4435 domain-containing protein [Streptomyces cyaneofuscatus]|uniref:DUF4435 domain-containing protein n=1 Tax=Streptomyces cyaneofuscatus TaxID=66883 RepID=UPI0036DB32ED
MRELLTADDLFSHLLILRGVSDKKFIFVEGDDDCGLIDPHLNEDTCETIPSGGRTVALGAAELADQQGIPGIGVVLDLDWADLLYPRIVKPHVFYTDSYDIDATAYAVTQNVVGLVINQSDRDRLRTMVPKNSAQTLTRSAERVALTVGVLRYLSERSRWELKLRDFPTHLVITGGIEVDLEKVVEITLQRSPNASISRENLLLELRNHIPSVSDPYRYCSGHDLLSAMAAMLRKVGGQVSAKSVGIALRSGFGCHNVAQSSLFRAINAWGATQGGAVLNCLPVQTP